MFLNLLHRRLSIKRRDNRSVLVHPGNMRDALTRVLGLPCKAESLRSVEGDRVVDLALAVSLRTLEGSLFGGLGLGGVRYRFEPGVRRLG